jgi:hypothetical protein
VTARKLLTKGMSIKHTAAMKRTTLWLTEAQIEKLNQISKKTGLGTSELIRRFVDEARAKKENK